ncbi:MAG: ribosome biogenesis protein [Nitrosopumilaceae archaeon]|nr:ribosome biogenesis protein [Nitrosopumilaceae archaeon]
MISLILAESSIELVPNEIQNHPSVKSHAKKMSKKTSDIFLDNSWHFAAMKGMKHELKRGRPDLVHFAALEATTIPLFFENKLNFYIHTINDQIIYFENNVRIPKSYHRFEGLFAKLFSEKSVSFGSKKLLEIKEKSFSELIDEINPSKLIGLSSSGKLSSCENIAKILDNNSCIVVGGFQKGDFSNSIKNQFDEFYSIDKTSLESHVVISRMLYEYEKTVFM